MHDRPYEINAERYSTILFKMYNYAKTVWAMEYIYFGCMQMLRMDVLIAVHENNTKLFNY